MTKTYGFDSKREAQNAKNVGAKVWDADMDHSDPESLLIVTANGPVEWNPSGPTEWVKDVTYRRATKSEWSPVRASEINKKLNLLSQYENAETYSALMTELGRLRGAK